MLKKDTGLCIRKVDYSESSQIVTFFTRDNGKIDGIAKGSKRAKSAFGGTIELFAFGDIVFTGGGTGLATITEFDPQVVFKGLGKNLLALNVCLFGAELLNLFTECYDSHRELFDRFIQFLKDASACEQDREIHGILILFQLSLLEQTGGKLVLDGCVNCRAGFSARWPKVYFSSRQSGFVCPDCEGSFADRLRISKAAAECLSDLKHLTGAGKKTLVEIEKVLVEHFTNLAHKRPRMARYF